MCNLYRMTRSASEVAGWFDAADMASGSNTGAEVYPGYPGLVVAGGEVRSMIWGFPLAQTSKKTGKPLKPKPVNNARSDKLDSFMWRHSFTERRCLIPVSAYAEAEGAKGSKTRTWLSVAGDDLFACAGIWRESEEWGAVYSMVMTDASRRSAEVHSRMPVILSGADHSAWLNGSAEDAQALCVPYSGELAIERTGDPWFKR